MAKVKNLGNRLQCSDCGIKFYDFNRPNPTCPKCGGEPQKQTKLNVPKAKPIPVAPLEEDEVEINAETDVDLISLDEIDTDLEDDVLI